MWSFDYNAELRRRRYNQYFLAFLYPSKYPTMPPINKKTIINIKKSKTLKFVINI